MKGVQCNELFGGIALINHTFFNFTLDLCNVIMYIMHFLFMLCLLFIDKKLVYFNHCFV